MVAVSDKRERLELTTTPTAPMGLLTPKQAAAWLACSLRTLYNLPIRRVKIGRCTRYDVRDLQLYADLHGTIDRLERAS
jgi:flavin reductase (DIM6/NTAB) family NADH-FMN oxidoreductase RutF